MHSIEFRYPGHVVSKDPLSPPGPGGDLSVQNVYAQAHTFAQLLNNIASLADDVAIALNMYEEAKVARAQAQAGIRDGSWSPSGTLPTGQRVKYAMRRPHIAALAFVTARDLLDKEAERARNELKRAGLLTRAKEQAALRDWKSALPGLTDVRNSVQHHDQRMRSKATQDHRSREEDIPLRPASDLAPAIQGAAPLNTQGTLLNDALTCTVADGRHLSVAVTVMTLDAAKEYVQALIDAVPWQ